MRCPRCGSTDTDILKTVQYDFKGVARRSHAVQCLDCERFFIAKTFPQVFANVYLVGRAFGGREEGGWWFDYGYPQASVPVKSWAEAREWIQRLREDERFSNEGRRDRHSVIGDETFEFYVETHSAEVFPKERPRYE